MVDVDDLGHTPIVVRSKPLTQKHLLSFMYG